LKTNNDFRCDARPNRGQIEDLTENGRVRSGPLPYTVSMML